MAQSNSTADSYCGTGFCVTAVYTPSTSMVSYTMVVQETTGWWAIAQGTQMIGANMAIGWVNPDNRTVTISHRSAVSHVMPVETNTSSPETPLFRTNANVSGVRPNSNETIYSWRMNLPNGGANASNVQHIFATSPTAPKSNMTNAVLRKHARTQVGIHLNLTKPYDGSPPAGLASVAAVNDESVNSLPPVNDESVNSLPPVNTTMTTPPVVAPKAARMRDLSKMSTRLFLAHMIVMTLAWMLCFPLGMLIARYGRTLFPWLAVHRAVSIFGAWLVIVGFGLAIGAVGSNGTRHFAGRHAKLGLSLCVLLAVQTALGVVAHLSRDSRFLGGFVHLPLGVVLFALSVWTIREGLAVWTWRAPAYVVPLLYAWSGSVAAAYLQGFVLCCRRERKMARERDAARVQHLPKTYSGDAKLYPATNYLRDSASEGWHHPPSTPQQGRMSPIDV